MPKFNWEGAAKNGDKRSGSFEADNVEQVRKRLRAEGITPKKIKKQGKDFNFSIGTGVDTTDILLFTRQLATMIDAGLPLVQCVDLLGTNAENPAFAKVLKQLKGSIEQGATFSESLRKHPKIFDNLYVNLVAAGEVGGILDTILNRLATYTEKAVKLKGQFKSALTYPISILAIAGLVVAVMLGKVIPVFEEMYKEFKGAVLPKPTQIVINISNWFRDRWYIFLGALIGIFMLISWILKDPRPRRVFDKIILKVPVIGAVMKKISVARFTRTLGTLLSSGVPILDSLDICAKTSGNMTIESAILHAKDKISEGKDLAGPLGDSKIFPPMVISMISVGESTGAMDAMLGKIADRYEEEVDQAVAAMTSMMEPFIMVFLGVVIGGLIVAMYLPVFELAGNVGN